MKDDIDGWEVLDDFEVLVLAVFLLLSGRPEEGDEERYDDPLLFLVELVLALEESSLLSLGLLVLSVSEGPIGAR